MTLRSVLMSLFAEVIITVIGSTCLTTFIAAFPLLEVELQCACIKYALVFFLYLFDIPLIDRLGFLLLDNWRAFFFYLFGW